MAAGLTYSCPCQLPLSPLSLPWMFSSLLWLYRLSTRRLYTVSPFRVAPHPPLLFQVANSYTKGQAKPDCPCAPLEHPGRACSASQLTPVDRSSLGILHRLLDCSEQSPGVCGAVNVPSVCLQSAFILGSSAAICAPSAAMVPACDLLSTSQFGLTTQLYSHAASSCAAQSPGRASDLLGIAWSFFFF